MSELCQKNLSKYIFCLKFKIPLIFTLIFVDRFANKVVDKRKNEVEAKTEQNIKKSIRINSIFKNK